MLTCLHALMLKQWVTTCLNDLFDWIASLNK